MNRVEELVTQLFTALDRHDYRTMAACYEETATFRDIAFDLRSRLDIQCMWHMICDGSNLRATFEVLHADAETARVCLVDHYTFRDTGRNVRNSIESHFTVHDGLITRHEDFCDARAWAAMAFGGLRGFLAGRSRLLRRRAATRKLGAFRVAHPEYGVISSRSPQ